MKLSDLARDIPGARLVGADVEVGAVEDDSRKVGRGALFVAVRGRRSDGHAFVGDVAARGAAAAVVEAAQPVGLPQLVVPSTADALGVLVARLAGRPGDRMALVGVTGTNGKTTTTYLVESILAAAGARPGVMGTVNYRYGGKTVEAPYTTPTPQVLHGVFAEMADAGTTHAVLEVSSAALAMGRLAGVGFRVAAFTNLTQDHLDVHGTMEAYQAAKALLFARHLADGGVAVVNVDDPAGAAMAAAAGGHRVLRVSSRPGAAAEIRVVAFESTVGGIRAELDTPRGRLAIASDVLVGHYNVDNLALAVGIGEALGLPHEAIARGVAAMRGVPGRVERVPNDAGLDVLVDYAHTPDALTNVLGALRPLTKRRLICVFGCGGDRDPTKRPKMGAAVATGADLAVVTSDNPRTEDPQAILDMILPAVPAPFFVDVDRRTAIRAALAEATPGDVVLIAGKGHEDYQILGTTKIHFDDREEAAEAIRLRPSYAVGDVLAACDDLGGAASVRGDGERRFSRVVIDGRTAAPGDLYVAIRGETHDGHAFCAQAVAAGARGVVVDRAGAAAAGDLGDASVIEVGDTREALGAIARLHRRRWGKRLIGITGSAGKTTTKELIAAALGAVGRCHRTKGSLNNETGVPLTLLGLRPWHDHAVIEMGMRGLGQIDYLARLAEPDVAIVTNAGVAHVGVVGSVEKIAHGKGEIFGRLPPDGVAIYPADDPRLAERAARAPRRLTFGEVARADVRLLGYQPVGAGGVALRIAIAPLGREVAVRLPMIGKHNALNATCAIAAAVALGVDPARAAEGLARAKPAAMRGELASAGGRTLYVDCYNANPASMDAALTAVAEIAAQAGAHAVAVVGDMLELGDEALASHRAVGARAAALGVPVVALGEHAAEVVASARAAGGAGEAAADPADAARKARALSAPGDWILIKGSRGMRMERVIPELGDKE